MLQRLDEWTKNYNDEYFTRQFHSPYRSTIKFCDWLEENEVLSYHSDINILDIPTGKGANLYYMSKRFPNIKYLGVDINNDFVNEGNSIFFRDSLNNCKLEVANLYNLDKNKHGNKYEGIISYQTLSWLPEYEDALNAMIESNPNWIAMTSLFYNGLVECKIEIQEYNNAIEKNSHKSSFYNVYSLPRIENYFKQKGYSIFKYCPFEIDIDLPIPDHTHMQTYTRKLMDGKRIQLSGPLLMNWFFIYASK